MTYAIIRTGGKQYRVQPGSTLRIATLPGDAGASVEFNEVLLGSDGSTVRTGVPYLTGAKVTGRIVRQSKARRVLHFRKEKEGWTRARGHRQPFTEVRILSITA